MLLIERYAPPDATPSERLSLGFEARSKSRLRTRLESGEEVGLFLARGAALHDGDKLAANDGRIVEVIAAPEKLMTICSEDPLQLARAAYHLGNRHVAVQIEATRLCFAADHVLGSMLQGLGLPVEEIVAPFEPESGAYGGHRGHTHSHDDERQTARIHDYSGAK